ncbi:hypothetical protein E1301_Tti012653 [Triplophysa tibetana]|uniref:Uncharacterized protein n=1 Tax=Triplophysa tibetana TaxID=1572043 RepID=A0A5A9PPC6_9TELE|nr:hypothetical protein E1301_Tti012653 [Triplophysa tibetana]
MLGIRQHQGTRVQWRSKRDSRNERQTKKKGEHYLRLDHCVNEGFYSNPMLGVTRTLVTMGNQSICELMQRMNMYKPLSPPSVSHARDSARGGNASQASEIPRDVCFPSTQDPFDIGSGSCAPTGGTPVAEVEGETSTPSATFSREGTLTGRPQGGQLRARTFTATALIGRYGTTPASSPKPGPCQGLAPTYSQSFSVLPGCTYSRSHTPLDCARRTDLTPWRGASPSFSTDYRDAQLMRVTSFPLHNLNKTVAAGPGGESGDTTATTQPPITSSVSLQLSGV